MAPPRVDYVAEVSEAVALVQPGPRGTPDEEKARRIEAITLRLAGMTNDQIGERLKINGASVGALLDRSLSEAYNRNVAEMRAVENDRLDRAQLAIWNKVLEGNLAAVGTFLKISAERSKINGLYAATKIDLKIGIREEMSKALAELEVLAAEVVVIDQLPEGA